MTTDTPPPAPEPAAAIPGPEPVPAQEPVPAPEPTAVAEPAPVQEPTAVVPVPPAPVAGPAGPRRRKRDRALGTAGQVIGIGGIVVCLLLIVGVVFARGWAVTTVTDVSSTIDTQIAKVLPLLDTAQSTVGEVSGRVSTVADIAAAIAADPNPGGDLADGLRTAIAGVNERYQGLREGYAGVRETVFSVVDRLQTLDQLIPGLSIPQGPIDALTTFDMRLQEFDTKVNDLLTIEPGSGPVNEAAGRISQAANGLDTRLAEVETSIGEVETKVGALRTDLANVTGTIDGAITAATISIVLLLLWIALLHWVLFRHSGEIRRGTSAA